MKSDATSPPKSEVCQPFYAVLSLQRLMSDLLVFSQPGKVTLLPALTSAFPTGKLSGLRTHGGHKLDISWADGELMGVVIHAGRNGICDFIHRNQTVFLKMAAGKQYRLDSQLRQL